MTDQYPILTNGRRPKKYNYIFIIILLSLISLILFSCATTNKTKSVAKTSIDSTVTVKVYSNVVKVKDSTTVKKDNTVTLTEKEDNYTKETVIEFDTATAIKTDSKDYFQPVKKITIRETGIKKQKQTIAANKVDSTKVVSNESTDLTKESKTELQKTETIKNKDVKRTSYWGWLWLLLLIPVYLVYRNWDKIKVFLKIV